MKIIKATPKNQLSQFQRALRIKGYKPYYRSSHGLSYLGNSLELLGHLPDESISLILTSPPFALRKKKNYGNVDAENYIDWFRPFAKEAMRVLRRDGSFVIEIGGAWMPKTPTRSLYQYELLVDLTKTVGFYLAQEFFLVQSCKDARSSSMGYCRTSPLYRCRQYYLVASKDAATKGG